jgi:uncharacterized protein with GYD domain
MAKYLFHASYTAEGAKGLLKDGGTKRKAMAEAAVKAAGGSMEAFYYAFGEADAVVIADFPDVVSATALSVTIASSGAVTGSMTPLITVEEMDAACQKPIGYQPPGQ